MVEAVNELPAPLDSPFIRGVYGVRPRIGNQAFVPFTAHYFFCKKPHRGN
jgi:hypothetical protein